MHSSASSTHSAGGLPIPPRGCRTRPPDPAARLQNEASRSRRAAAERGPFDSAAYFTIHFLATQQGHNVCKDGGDGGGSGFWPRFLVIKGCFSPVLPFYILSLAPSRSLSPSLPPSFVFFFACQSRLSGAATAAPHWHLLMERRYSTRTSHGRPHEGKSLTERVDALQTLTPFCP